MGGINWGSLPATTALAASAAVAPMPTMPAAGQLQAKTHLLRKYEELHVSPTPECLEQSVEP